MLPPVEAEPLLSGSFHLFPDLLHCLAGKGLFILLRGNDLLREGTKLFNVLTTVNLPERCF